MSPLVALQTLAVVAAFSVVALALGDAVVDVVERLVGRRGARLDDAAVRAGAALLVGFGTIANVGVLLGLAHVFHAGVLVALAAVCLVATRRRLGWWYGVVRRLHVRERLTRRPLLAAGVAAAAILLAVSFQAALAPPTAWDELAYHLPQAQRVADSHTLPLVLGNHYFQESHYFYGNIPKLGEVLFAEGIALGGFEAARALHVAVLAAFVLLVFGTLRRFFGAGAGVLAVVLLLLDDQLVHPATTGYIDGITIGFEVGALLAVVTWVQSRASVDFARGAVLIGLALGTKYSAGATLLFLAVVAAAAVVAARTPLPSIARMAGAAVALVTAAGGFWYLKNAIRYGNPAYPLYLGHEGVDRQRYESLLAAIRQFQRPRTLQNFLETPREFLTPALAHVGIALCLVPVAAFVTRSATFVRLLALYVVIYSAYWFFIASHVLRYLLPATTVALILLAVLATHPFRLAARVAVAALALALVLALHPSLPVDAARALPQTLSFKLRGAQARYTTGESTRDEYLTRHFGCQYRALDYLDENDLEGNVIDNWSIWHDPNLAIYARDNKLTALPIDDSPLRVRLRRYGIRYLYVREGTRRRFFAETDPVMVAHRTARAPLEARLTAASDLVWQEEDCRLFRLPADLVGKAR